MQLSRCHASAAEASKLLEEELEGEDACLPDGWSASDLQLVHTLWLNEAQCALKSGAFHEAEECCDKVFKRERKSVKAWFRRGVARMGLQQYECATEDFKEARA